jgi:hypothetical protein
MRNQLPLELMQSLYASMAKAKDLLRQGETEAAENIVLECWASMPEPKFEWGYSGMLVAETVAFYVDAGMADSALNWAPKLFECYSNEDAASHLLLAKALFQSGDDVKAAEHLALAYKFGGQRTFRGEDRKYLELIKKKSRTKQSKPQVSFAGPLHLPDDVHASIQELCAQGDALAKAQNYMGAIDNYTEALLLVPEPKVKWEATLWIYTALGDAYFLMRDYASCADYFDRAMECPGAEKNPFIRLRRGQAAFEQGKDAKAADELREALELGGEEIFQGEDAKYRQIFGVV